MVMVSNTPQRVAEWKQTIEEISHRGRITFEEAQRLRGRLVFAEQQDVSPSTDAASPGKISTQTGPGCYP